MCQLHIHSRRELHAHSSVLCVCVQEYRGTVIAVTHDRYFLDNIAQWILEVRRHQATFVWREGSYLCVERAKTN